LYVHVYSFIVGELFEEYNCFFDRAICDARLFPQL